MKSKTVKPILVKSEVMTSLGTIGNSALINIDTSHKEVIVKGVPSIDYWELILISLDDEIKDGNLVLLPNNTLHIMTHSDMIGYLDSQSNSTKKVIARQSQVSPEYIQEFIEEYNNGKVEDIEIEMNEVTMRESSSKYENNDILVNGDIVDSIDHTLTEVIDKTIESYNKTKLTNGFITIVERDFWKYYTGI